MDGQRLISTAHAGTGNQPFLSLKWANTYLVATQTLNLEVGWYVNNLGHFVYDWMTWRTVRISKQ